MGRPYVTDFSKRNNMGYAMCAMAMGVNTNLIKKGADLAKLLRNEEAGTWDGEEAIASYDAGIELMKGESLKNVMDKYGRDMQVSSMRNSKEWPSIEITNKTYLVLETNFYIYLEHLAGENE